MADATNKITTQLVIEGESSYTSALDKATQSFKTMDSQLGLLRTQYGKYGSTMEENQQIQDKLKEKIAEQEKYVTQCADALNKAASEHGEFSKEAEKATQALAGAQTKLEKMNQDLDDTAKNAPEAEKATSTLGSAIKDTLASAAEKAATVLGGVTKALGFIVEKGIEAGKWTVDYAIQTGKLADGLLTLSDQSGVAVESLAQWQYASQYIDTPVESITGSIKKLTQNMQSGSDQVSWAAKTLGISFTDATGQMRPAEDVFFEIVDALGGVENETQRNQLAMALLGKSATDLNPLINAGSQAFIELGQSAADAGLVMSGDTISAFGAFDDTMNDFNTALGAAKATIVAAFLPSIQSITASITDVVEALVGMMNGAEGARENMTAAIQELTQNIVTTLTESLPTILDMGFEIITTLISGLLEALPELVDPCIQFITDLVGYLTEPDMLQKLIECAIELVLKLAEGLVKAIPQLLKAIPQIIEAIVGAFSEQWDTIKEIGLDLIKGIWEGISDAAAWLWEKVSGWCGDLVDKIKGWFGISSPSKVMRDQVGHWMGEGVAEGIIGAKADVDSALAGLVDAEAVQLPGVALGQLSAGAVRQKAELAISASVDAEMIAGAVVRGIRASGIGNASVTMDGREIGRYMRAGIGVSFV